MGWFLTPDARVAAFAWEKRGLWLRQWDEWFALCARGARG